jgi:hypothetical protein
VGDLRIHLESLWISGMSWENYGVGENKWCIDHILPTCSFTFSSYEDEEFKTCWALSNLRPLWYKENCIKGKKVA